MIFEIPTAGFQGHWTEEDRVLLLSSNKPIRTGTCFWIYEKVAHKQKRRIRAKVITDLQSFRFDRKVISCIGIAIIQREALTGKVWAEVESLPRHAAEKVKTASYRYWRGENWDFKY